MPKTDKQRLVILDTHAIIHRAYHALPDFQTRDGFPTGALYGVATMILKIIDDFKPDYIVAGYDLPGKTFRHEAFSGYKGTRSKTDEQLVMQIKRSRDLIKAFNIPVYEAPGFEADDVLGTIVEQTKDIKNLEVIIASGDMDTLQLIDGDRVKVFTLKRGLNDTVVYNEDAVQERYKFHSDLIPDYKGLRGDPSDNIPGVKGIGEKGATQLITTYGSLEKMFSVLEKEDGQEVMEAAGVKKRTIKLLSEGKADAEFSKILATIRRDAPIDFVLPKEKWTEGLDFEAIDEICREFEFRTLPNKIRAAFGSEEVLEEMEAVINEEVDQRELEEVGIAVWLLNSEISEPSLQEIKTFAGVKTFDEAKTKILAEIKVNQLEQVYREIELPIIDTVHAMGERGIMLDLEYLKDLSEKYHAELKGYEKTIYDIAGEEFNIKSPKQLGVILFEKMELPTKGIKKTASGGYSTKESELEKLREESDIIEAILRYRELQKLLSTYIDNLPDMVGDDGRLHSKLVQTGTTTGRFSSQDPNLQNIPIRTEHGAKIRHAFVAAPGYKLVAADYSQVELRVAAIMANDEYMKSAFIEGRDIHAAVAARVFGVAEDEVTNEMRSRAKTINFGILYGMGVNALKKNLGTSRAEAQDFYNKYFEQFSSIQQYLDQTKAFALKNGYTETMFGRRRYFPALKSKIPFMRAMAERMAINAPIQGTATADIIKLAIKHVRSALQEAQLLDDVYFLLQVHDELVFEITEDKVDEAIAVIVPTMEGVLKNSYLKYETDVPLKVNAAIGDNWGEAK